MRVRPLNVITYAADQQGCGFHRMIVPANLLRASGGARVKTEQVLHNGEWHEAFKPDVIVFQRQYEKRQVETIRDIRQRCPNAFLVYEIDDLLTEIPQRNYHSSFISKSIAGPLKEAMLLCDRVVVTTNELAKWAREEIGAEDVVVVPNYLPANYMKERGEPENKKLVRVGWAGGVSHSGDLDLLKEAIASVKNVQWVFFGMKPEMELPENIEFQEFVPIYGYMDKLASLNLDLMLAPLEDNRFNQCKSDLKLLEAAAVGAAVIATPTEPYQQFKPPVFSWARTPAEWRQHIQRFADSSYSLRKSYSRRMQAWFTQHRTYEANIATRNTAWLPKPADLWCPSQEKSSPRPFFIVSQDKQHASHAKIYADLQSACVDALAENGDVLWLRKGTSITTDGIKRLRVALIDDTFTASVAPLASDGCNAFPRINQLTPVQTQAATLLNGIVMDVAKDARGMMPAFSGPAIMLRNQGLQNLGAPDSAAYFGDEELALAEWTANATELGMRNIQLFDVYAGATSQQAELNEAKVKRLEARNIIKYVKAQASPLDQDIRAKIELKYHAATWKGIDYNAGGLSGDYAAWAALKPDPVPISDGSKVDVRHYNTWAEESKKPYVLYCGEGDILQPFTLGLVQDAFEAGADLVFGDHEEIDEHGHIAPHFKSGFDATLLKSSDYLGPVHAIKRELDDERALFYKFRQTAGKSVMHIPHVLARTKKRTVEEGIAISEVLARINRELDPGSASTLNPYIPDAGFVNFRPVSIAKKTVAVIVRLSENPDNVASFLATLINNTEDEISRIILLRQEFIDVPVNLGEYADNSLIQVVDYPHKNVSKALNFAASGCREDILVFMTDELRVLLPTWLDSMKAYLEDETVGAVGARIYNQAGRVVHAGIIVSNGIASVVHSGLPGNSTGYFGQATLSHETTAVSYRCMAIRRSVFDRFRFDKEFALDLGDCDLGVRLSEAGYVQIVDCSAQFVTTEHSRNPDFEDFNHFGKRHRHFQDRYLNPNLLVSDVKFDYSTLKSYLSAPTLGQQRVLIINDSQDLAIASEYMTFAAKRGQIIFRALIDGFNLVLLAPVLDNVKSFDMRDPKQVGDALAMLQINVVVMPSMLGASAAPAIVECVNTLRRIGIPFEYAGPPEHMVCPRLTLQVDGKDCDKGYLKGAPHCQGCVNQNGSPFGIVDVQAWLHLWYDYSQTKLKAA